MHIQIKQLILLTLVLTHAVAVAQIPMLPAATPDPTIGRNWSVEECQATRLQLRTRPRVIDGTYSTEPIQEACYGLFQRRNDILASCGRHPIDFEQTCQKEPAPWGQVMKPLQFAIADLNVDAVTVLLAARADAKKPEHLHALNPHLCVGAAALPKCREIIRLLVLHGADINALYARVASATPVSMVEVAIGAHNPALLDILLEAKADINATGAPCNALDSAYIRGSKDEITWLEARNAKRTFSCIVERHGETIVKLPLLPLCLLGWCNRY